MTQLLSAKQNKWSPCAVPLMENLTDCQARTISHACRIYMSYICRASCWHGPWGKLSQHEHSSTTGSPSLQPQLFGNTAVYILYMLYMLYITRGRWKKMQSGFTWFSVLSCVEIITQQCKIDTELPRSRWSQLELGQQNQGVQSSCIRQTTRQMAPGSCNSASWP